MEKTEEEIIIKSEEITNYEVERLYNICFTLSDVIKEIVISATN